MALEGKRPAVFLDRDVTIIEDVPYLFEPDKVKLIKGAGVAIKNLNSLGFRVLVVTNQSGVGRGYFKEADVEAVHKRLSSLLDLDGASIDGYFWCPHKPDEGCACRKPGTQMIDRALKKYPTDIENSYVIGDKSLDMGLAENAGATSILVKTGLGAEVEEEEGFEAGFVANDIAEAVEWIMARKEGATL